MTRLTPRLTSGPTSRRRLAPWIWLLAVAAGAGMLLTACGSGDSGTDKVPGATAAAGQHVSDSPQDGKAKDDGDSADSASGLPENIGVPKTPTRVTYANDDSGDKSTVVWDGEDRVSINEQNATKFVYVDGANFQCDLEDNSCITRPGGNGPILVQSSVEQAAALGPKLADGEHLDPRTIVGIDTQCVRVDSEKFADDLGPGVVPSTITWCIDPKTGLILHYEFSAKRSDDANLNFSETAVAVGKPKADDFKHPGAVS